MKVEALLCIARGHLDTQVADHKGPHDKHYAVSLQRPIMEAYIRGCECQAEDHNPDAHQVSLEEQVKVLAPQCLERVVNRAARHTDED